MPNPLLQQLVESSEENDRLLDEIIEPFSKPLESKITISLSDLKKVLSELVEDAVSKAIERQSILHEYERLTGEKCHEEKTERTS